MTRSTHSNDHAPYLIVYTYEHHQSRYRKYIETVECPGWKNPHRLGLGLYR
jgi:hypothetical protein